jgi:spermidine synthase
MLLKSSDLWYSEYYVDDDVKLSLRIDEILHTEQTPFQKLELYRNETYGVFMALDGYIQVTEKDEFVYHDMICHPAMCVNPDIKRVLIIGGGDGGAAREVARYRSVERIDQVEIDEAVVRACQKHMPLTASVFESEPRLNLMFDDGLKFVREAPDGAYDLILVDSTDPAGPGEGLFTTDFYRDCHRALSERGILINQHEGAFYEGDAEDMKKARGKLQKTFPIARVFGFNTPTYASGYWYFGFASKNLDPIADMKPEIWKQFGLKTKYYNLDVHRGAFALPGYVQDILASADAQ